MRLSTADCICIFGFWGLRPRPHRGSAPWPRWGTSVPQAPFAHPTSKPWLRQPDSTRFTVFYRAMHYSAKRGLLSVRTSVTVRLSLTLVEHDHIGGKSWKLIARKLAQHLRSSLLFVAQRSSRGTWKNFGEAWVGWEKVTCSSTIRQYLWKALRWRKSYYIWRAYRKSPTLFQFWGRRHISTSCFASTRLRPPRRPFLPYFCPYTAQQSVVDGMDFLASNHVCIVGLCIAQNLR